MQTLEQAKEFCDMILDETNIKALLIPIGESDMGAIELGYYRESREFKYHIGNKDSTKVPSETAILGIVKGCFTKK